MEQMLIRSQVISSASAKCQFWLSLREVKQRYYLYLLCRKQKAWQDSGGKGQLAVCKKSPITTISSVQNIHAASWLNPQLTETSSLTHHNKCTENTLGEMKPASIQMFLVSSYDCSSEPSWLSWSCLCSEHVEHLNMLLCGVSSSLLSSTLSWLRGLVLGQCYLFPVNTPTHHSQKWHSHCQ